MSILDRISSNMSILDRISNNMSILDRISGHEWKRDRISQRFVMALDIANVIQIPFPPPAYLLQERVSTSQSI